MSNVGRDKKIDELLLSIHEEELERDEKRYSEETAECPTWSRARALALDPSAASDVERAHLRSCPHCAARMNSFQSLIHPPLLDLVKHELGLLGGDAAVEVEHHLREEQCWQCLRLRRTRWVSSLLSAASAGTRSLEALADAASRALRGADYITAPVALYAAGDARRAPYASRFEQGRLSVILEEREGGMLLVHVEADDPALEGETIGVELAGESDSLAAEVTLRRHDGRLVGRHYVPGFAERRAGLKRILVLAAPVGRAPEPPPPGQTP